MNLDQVVQEEIPWQVPMADDRIKLVQEVLCLRDEFLNLRMQMYSIT